MISRSFSDPSGGRWSRAAFVRICIGAQTRVCQVRTEKKPKKNAPEAQLRGGTEVGNGTIRASWAAAGVGGIGIFSPSCRAHSRSSIVKVSDCKPRQIIIVREPP